MIDLRNSMAMLRRNVEDTVSRFVASDHGQRVIGWYEHLSPRDRLALRSLGGFAVVVVLYSLLLQPMIGFSSRAERHLQEERALAVLQAVLGKVRATPPPIPVAALRGVP